MRNTDTGSMQRAFAAAVVLLIGVGSMFVGFAGGASAANPRTADMICHPVSGNGSTGSGYNIIGPDQASSHIIDGVGQHTVGGVSDVVMGSDLLCPGEQPPHFEPDTETGQQTVEGTPDC